MKIRQLSDLYKINGQPIYAPDRGCKVQFESGAAEGSGRTDDFVMHITWVRRIMRKVYMTYSAMTDEEIAFILDKVQGKEYTLTYKDPILGIHTINCYTANSEMDLWSGVYLGGLWRNVTFNCIEL